jgi:hypothetical protein
MATLVLIEISVLVATREPARARWCFKAGGIKIVKVSERKIAISIAFLFCVR